MSSRKSPPPAPMNMEQVWSEIQELGGPSAPPATVLSLNSIFPSNQEEPRCPLLVPFDSLPSSVFPQLPKKGQPESSNAGDSRYKRMMKNRESASRSRARKQAYVSGLQMKIGHLLNENDKLRNQLNNMAKMQAEAAYHGQHPARKNVLPRTKTAPF